LIAERSAWPTIQRRCGVAPRIQRRATSTSRPGWSLPMSLRLLATERRT
jgi:hypothetical protein